MSEQVQQGVINKMLEKYEHNADQAFHTISENEQYISLEDFHNEFYQKYGLQDEQEIASLFELFEPGEEKQINFDTWMHKIDELQHYYQEFQQHQHEQHHDHHEQQEEDEEEDQEKKDSPSFLEYQKQHQSSDQVQEQNSSGAQLQQQQNHHHHHNQQQQQEEEYDEEENQRRREFGSAQKVRENMGELDPVGNADVPPTNQGQVENYKSEILGIFDQRPSPQKQRLEDFKQRSIGQRRERQVNFERSKQDLVGEDSTAQNLAKDLKSCGNLNDLVQKLNTTSYPRCKDEFGGVGSDLKTMVQYSQKKNSSNLLQFNQSEISGGYQNEASNNNLLLNFSPGKSSIFNQSINKKKHSRVPSIQQSQQKNFMTPKSYDKSKENLSILQRSNNLQQSSIHQRSKVYTQNSPSLENSAINNNRNNFFEMSQKKHYRELELSTHKKSSLSIQQQYFPQKKVSIDLSQHLSGSKQNISLVPQKSFFGNDRTNNQQQQQPQNRTTVSGLKKEDKLEHLALPISWELNLQRVNSPTRQESLRNRSRDRSQNNAQNQGQVGANSGATTGGKKVKLRSYMDNLWNKGSVQQQQLQNSQHLLQDNERNSTISPQKYMAGKRSSRLESHALKEVRYGRINLNVSNSASKSNLKGLDFKELFQEKLRDRKTSDEAEARNLFSPQSAKANYKTLFTQGKTSGGLADIGIDGYNNNRGGEDKSKINLRDDTQKQEEDIIKNLTYVPRRTCDLMTGEQKRIKRKGSKQESPSKLYFAKQFKIGMNLQDHENQINNQRNVSYQSYLSLKKDFFN